MDYPDSLHAIINRAAKEHRDSIDQAVDCAYDAWKADGQYAEFADQMVRQAVRELIHRVRHQENVEVRREAGVYGQPAKTTLATGAVERVARNCLMQYSICGVALGFITGKQLVAFAKIEQEKADGSAFNARLCRRLSELVPEDKTVAQVVTAKRVEKLMKELAGRTVRKREAVPA